MKPGTRLGLVLLLPALLALGGCSTGQVYNAAQAWQQQRCSRVADLEARRRCMAPSAASHEDYRREAESARRAP